MGASDLILAAAAGAVCLALAATFWAIAQGKALGARLHDQSGRLKEAEFQAEAARGAVDAFDGACKKASVKHDMKVYAGAPHSFFDRKQSEFADASADAWKRVQSFVKV